MFAIIQTGGKQYRVAKDDKLEIEKRDAHQGQVKHVVFDPDNKHFVSFGGGELILWEMQQREPIGKIQLSEDLRDLAYTSDGRFLIGCTTGGRVVSWHIHPDSWADLAHRKANRDFTEKERSRYLDVDV